MRFSSVFAPSTKSATCASPRSTRTFRARQTSKRRSPPWNQPSSRFRSALACSMRASTDSETAAMSVSIACLTPRRSARSVPTTSTAAVLLSVRMASRYARLRRLEPGADRLQGRSRLIGDSGGECGPNRFEPGAPFGERLGRCRDVGQVRVCLEQGQGERRLQCGAICGGVHELAGGVDGQTGSFGGRRSVGRVIGGQIGRCGEHRPGRLAHVEEHRCVLIGLGKALQVETVDEWGDVIDRDSQRLGLGLNLAQGGGRGTGRLPIEPVRQPSSRREEAPRVTRPSASESGAGPGASCRNSAVSSRAARVRRVRWSPTGRSPDHPSARCAGCDGRAAQ